MEEKILFERKRWYFIFFSCCLIFFSSLSFILWNSYQENHAHWTHGILILSVFGLGLWIIRLFLKERKLALKLVLSEHRYHSLVNNIPFVVWQSDKNGKTLFISQNVTKVIGYTQKEYYNSDTEFWFGRIHPEDIKRVRKAYEGIFKEKEFDLEYRFQRKDGRWIWIHDRAIAIETESEGNPSVCGVFSDIATQKEASLKIEETLNLKSEFISLVSHELRTPLTTMLSGIDLLRRGVTGTLTPKQKEIIGTIKRNSDRLRRLINDVLDFQKLEAQRLEFHFLPNSLNEVIKQTVKDFSSIMQKKNVKAELSLTKGLPEVVCDRDRIVQVLTNLLGNAIKFTGRGKITISSELKENKVYISIIDEGIGIKEEDQNKLFQGFSQIYTEGNVRPEGTGLGLAISRKIIEDHGGEIGMKSQFGKGATFYFWLPVKQAIDLAA